MSLLLKDRIYTMQAPTAKRGVYPMHGYKLGLYRMPIKLDDPAEIKSILEGMKKTFAMDQYADRIYATYNWIEENKPDPDADGYEYVDLSVTVEIVTGEVIDAIYQIYPVEKFSAPQWVQNYRKKADHFAKMIIDTLLRNTILADKMVEYYMKKEQMSEVQAVAKLEELTPLAQIVLDAKPIAKIEKPKPAVEGKKQVIARDGEEVVPGPIDIELKIRWMHLRHSKPRLEMRLKPGEELEQITKSWVFGESFVLLTLIFVLEMEHVLMHVLWLFTNSSTFQEMLGLQKNRYKSTSQTVSSVLHVKVFAHHRRLRFIRWIKPCIFSNKFHNC